MRERIDNLLAGDYRAWAFGDGAELAQVRPYELGDDVRRIDWNVTARTGEPHVRLHVAERAVETWLVLDTSASMTFGTADRRKWDVAEGVAHRGRPLRRAARQPPRRVDLRRPHADDLAARGRAAPACCRCCSPCGKEPDLEPVGPTSLGTALGRIGRLARRRSVVDRRLGLPRPARLAAAAAPPLGPPRRDRGRDPRPARAAAHRRRRPLARRPGDGPAAPRRHAQPQAPAAVRRARRRRPRRGRGASFARSASATSCSPPRATG